MSGGRGPRRQTSSGLYHPRLGTNVEIRVDAAVPEVVECLAAAEHWWKASGGAFHPAAARLRALWLAAEADQRPLGDDELAVTGRRPIVRACDAMTADAIATAVNVLAWPTAEPLVADLIDVAVLSVDAAGLVLWGNGWG